MVKSGNEFSKPKELVDLDMEIALSEAAILEMVVGLSEVTLEEVERVKYELLSYELNIRNLMLGGIINVELCVEYMKFIQILVYHLKRLLE